MSTGREKFNNNKIFIQIALICIKIFPRFVRLFLWDMIRSYSQILFVGMRYLILKSLIAECGDNVKIGTNVTIISWSKLRIGTNVSIHADCYIDATGEIVIGDNVSIAHHSSILSAEHTWSGGGYPYKI